MTTNRVRWFGPSEQKMHKIKTGHTYSYVKLNFRVDLFSCIFWFEAIFCCFLAFYIYPILQGKNGQNKPENQQNWNMAKRWALLAKVTVFGPQKMANQNTETTFIVQTFPKYGPYDFYFMNLSFLGAILAIF